MLSIFSTSLFALVLFFTQYSVIPTSAVNTYYCQKTYNYSNLINASMGYVKLRSTGYPANVLNANSECRLAVQSNSYKMWVGFISGKASRLDFTTYGNTSQFINFDVNKQPYSYLSVYNSFQMYFSKNSSTTWTAFDAVALSITTFQKCPFSGQLVPLEDDLVIPFASTFDDITKNVTSARKCIFEFTVPAGKILKLVWRYADFDPNNNWMTLIRTDNGQNVSESIGQVNVTSGDDVVQYFSGNYFNFNYTSITSRTGLGFYAYVSAVDSIPDSTLTNCDSLTPNSKAQIWSNIDLVDGYSKNQQMCNSLSVQKTQEVSINPVDMFVERCCDAIYIGQNANLTAATKLKGPLDFYYSVRDVDSLNLMWKSDDSVQQVGFNVEYQIHDCTCAPQQVKIPCNDSMFVTPILNDNYYCSGIKCNFTITQDDGCPEKYIYVSLRTAFRSDSDKLVLYQNNRKVASITNNSPDSFPDPNYFYLSPKYPLQLIFEADVYQEKIQVDRVAHFVEVYSTLFPKPAIQKIVLTDNSPSTTFSLNELGGRSGITVCSPKNVLELFISSNVKFLAWNYYKLFDADDLFNFVTDFYDATNFTFDPTSNVPQKITSNSGCFTIFNVYAASAEPNAVAFFRIKDVQSKNCQNNNVFNSNGTITVSATGEGFCDLVLLPSYFSMILIQNVSTTSTSAVTVYPMIYPNRTLFAFDSSTTSSYSTIGFYSPAIGLRIPANETITVSVVTGYQNIFTNSVNKSGVLASPDYCGSGDFQTDNTNLLYFVQFLSMSQINVTVDYLKTGLVSIQSSSQTHELTAGEQYTFTGSYFNVYYKIHEATNTSGFLLHYVSTEAVCTDCSTQQAAHASLNFGLISIILLIFKFCV